MLKVSAHLYMFLHMTCEALCCGYSSLNFGSQEIFG